KGDAVSATTASALLQSAPVLTDSTGLTGFADVTDTLSISVGDWYAYPALSQTYVWYACDSAHSAGTTLPEDCSVISDESNVDLTIGVSLLGKYVLASETTSNTLGSTVLFTATSSAVHIAPKNTVAPVISGSATVGGSLSVTSGTWDADPSPTFDYQWLRCDSSIASVTYLVPQICAAISEATTSSYSVVQADTGSHLAVLVSAVNDLGDKDIVTVSTAAVTSAPVLVNAPAFAFGSSTAKPSATALASSGTWQAYPTASYSYEWYDCASADSCIKLSGSSDSYNAGSLTSGHYLKFKVTASNSVGSASSWSTTSSQVLETPRIVQTGSVAGNAYEGQSLSLTATTFAGFPSVSVSTQWYACSSAPAADAATVVAGCDAISGETGSSLSVLRSMQGKYLAVLESATNTISSVHVWSSVSAAVATIPVLSLDPAVSGTALAGSVLSVSSGTWTASPTPSVAYEWFACDAAQVASASLASGCATTSVTASTFTLTSSQNGKFLLAKVTASNVTGAISRYSASSAEVREMPANTVAPVVSGTALVGNSLTVSDGTFTGFPAPVISYQWYSCTSAVAASSATLAAGCSSIGSATASSFSLTASYGGKYLLASVSATNSVGTKTIYSASSAYVKQSPVISVAPSITGTARAGSTLTASNGTWTAFPSVTSYSYLWFACTAAVLESATQADSCTSTATTTSSFALTSSNAGSFMVVRVTATNASGSASYFSASTVAVSDAPVNTVAPVVTGTAMTGQVLTTTAGTWTGYPTPGITYAWYSCTSTHASSSTTLATGCTLISGATSSTFTLTSTQVGKYIESAVTATNAGGTKTVWSASTSIIASLISNSVAPSFSSTSTTGIPVPGDILTGTNGTWSSTPAATYTYRWLQCSATKTSSTGLIPSGCVAIPGETLNTHEITDADVGSYLMFAVLASNGSSTLEAFSATGTQVLQDIAVVTEPTFSGASALGTATVSNGTWQGYPAPTIDATFEICSNLHTDPYIINGFDSCVPIDAVANQVALPADSVGKYLRLTLNVWNDRQSLLISYSSAKISGAPSFAYAPNIAGRGQIGQVLTLADVNVWAEPAVSSYSYVWYSCAQTQSTVSLVAANCTNVTAAAETTTHTAVASEAGQYEYVVVTANNGSATSKLSNGVLISPATDAQVTSATALKTFSTVPSCTGTTWYNCGLNLGSSNLNKLVFATGSIGSVANLTGVVLFDQTKDQLTFTVTNATAGLQRVDLNSLVTNSDGCTGTPTTNSLWLAASQTKSVTMQMATLGSFAITQNCTFGFALNSLLVASITLSNNGSTAALAAPAFSWSEGFYGYPCLMNVKTLRYSVCSNAVSVDLATGNDINVTTKITWDATLNTLTYSVVNNTGSSVYIKLREGQTGLCHNTSPAAITNELTVRAGRTYSPNSATSVAAQTLIDFDSDTFFNEARINCSITVPGLTSEYNSLVATVQVSTVPGL
ncbi:MAG: hypothetical protein ACKOWE_02895, partial [Micrococcales bacterium]